eukprot:235725-Alexandrium_andersonii.AAC.1
MSASLVGSEMCIRDRSDVPRTQETIADASTGGCNRAGKRDPARTSPPVSYTHLTLPTICSV